MNSFMIPKTVAELLPDTSEQDHKTIFVAVGPILIESLANGEDLYKAAEKAKIRPEDALKLFATPEFAKYVEAYLTLGDITDRQARLRLGRSILAAAIASGMTLGKKRDVLDILEYLRRETEVRRGRNIFVGVKITNDSVPRPYNILTSGEETDNGSGEEGQEIKETK